MQNKIKKLLRTWEEYNQINFDTPYIIRKEKDNKKLVYLGVKHSFKPEEEQFEIIRTEFENFSNLEGNKIVVIEGGDKWQTLETEEETIKRYGEPAFVKQLTQRENIEFISPEPTKEEMYEFVKDKFSEEEIIYYKVAQQSLHYTNIQAKISEEEFLQRIIDLSLIHI